MLSAREHEDWALKEHKDREYQTEAERRFFDAMENPEPPTDDLKEMVRVYGKYAADKDR